MQIFALDTVVLPYGVAIFWRRVAISLQVAGYP